MRARLPATSQHLQARHQASKTRRPWWQFSARELRVHAVLYAIAAWTFAAVLLITGDGLRTAAGVLKFQDFVQFYTLGHLAAAGDARAIADYDSLHRAQGELIPAAAELIYPPVYPPYTALIFAPFSALPFFAAAALWVCLTALLYAVIVRIIWRAVSTTVPDGKLVAATALAFPPFWNLVMNGQVTIIVLGAFTLGWLALERRRPFLAGAALGLLASKPQFGLVLAALVLFRREWWMLAGAVVSATVQVGLAVVVLDAAAIAEFVRGVPRMIAQADVLEANPAAGHSLRTLTRLLPSPVGSATWIVLAGGVVVMAVRTWRPDVPLRLRYGIVVLAAVLVNPHLIIYDATLLVLPLLLIAGWMEAPGQQHSAARPRLLMHALIIAFAIPAAQLIRVQPSVLLMTALFVLVSREALRAARVGRASSSEPERASSV